ncbi:LOW QUALITY PROTEIN: transmembrane protein 221 [Heptranchias perlo]|uniref:LOW QUALITY PROTEIN: transmembrane protein 221 n=1 Tax=Heptranchias perlo TaxID=212740 RepID=UPI00355A381C
MQQEERRAAAAAPGSLYLSPDRCLAALLLLAALAGLMSLLSATLLLELGSQQPGVSLSPVPGALARRVLRSVSQGLTALSVSLHLCCLLLALMHGYLAAEVCGGEADPDRAGWLLLNSQAARHVALSAFCLGVIVYLAALSIYVLLEFEKETAIACAGILAAGVLALSVIVIHALAKAWRVGRRSLSLPERAPTLFENSRAPRGGWPNRDQNPEHPDPGGEEEEEEDTRLPAFRRETAYERYREQKAFYVATSASHVGQSAIPAATGRDGYAASRVHTARAGLSRAQRAGPWDGVTHEMRRVLARKGAICRKDSTLV